MKKFFTIIAVITVCACAANIMARKDAYQAFPVAPKEFEGLKSYSVITFHANPILAEAEAGNAWYMVLRYPSGKIEKHVAVRAMLGKEHVFLTVVSNPAELKGIFIGVHAVLLSHDAKYYFNAKAEMFAAPAKLKGIDWEKTATALQDEVVEEVTAESGEHEQIKKWFVEVTKDEVAKRLNTTLSEDEYKILKKNSKGAKIATELAVNGMTFGIIFGEVFAFTKSWELALANATLMETVRLLSMLFGIAKPDFNFPEYGSGNVTRWELAEKILQYTETLVLYADVTSNLTKVVEAEHWQNIEQEKKMQELEKKLAILQAEMENLQEEVEGNGEK